MINQKTWSVSALRSLSSTTLAPSPPSACLKGSTGTRVRAPNTAAQVLQRRSSENRLQKSRSGREPVVEEAQGYLRSAAEESPTCERRRVT
jgi:hypothetical protein